jgi:hypothetical protein
MNSITKMLAENHAATLNSHKPPMRAADFIVDSADPVHTTSAHFRPPFVGGYGGDRAIFGAKESKL